MPRSGRLGRFALGFVGGVLVGAIALAVWFAVTGALAARDVVALRAGAQDIDDAVDQRSYAAAVLAIPDAAGHAAALHSRLSSAPWSWAQDFPVVGPSVAAGAVLAAATDDLLSQFDGWSHGLVAAGASGDLALVTTALAAAAPDLAATAVVAERAAERVAAIEPDALPGPVRDKVAWIRKEFLDVVQPLSQGASVARVLPGILGAEAPARWLLVLSQPSEARGSGGGFYGAYTSVVVADGQFSMESAQANGSETRDAQDLSSLPEEYRRLWGSDAQYLWGFNLTRHYPYSASVAWRALDPTADYVVSMDPRAVAGLLSLTGPVTVDGVSLDKKNAERFFVRDIYVRYPDAREKDRVMLAFLEQVFAELASTRLDPDDLWRALGPAVAGQHIQVWSPQEDIAAALADSPLGATVPDDPGPWVTAAFNNTAGNKIDSYIDSSLEYRVAGSCGQQSVAGTLTATLALGAIPDGLPPYISGRNDWREAPYGTTSMYVHLYGPVGAVGATFTVNGEPTPVTAGTERGHPVWGAKVQLSPDRPVAVAATFSQPGYPGEALTALPQPMVQDTEVTVVDERTCARE